MTTNELALLDTNVLVYAYYPESLFYRASSYVLNQAQQEDAGLCVSSQVLAEFFSVITNPKRVDPALSSQEAAEKVNEIKALPGMTVLALPVDVVDRWVALLSQRPVRGKKIFDLQIAATMLANGVRKIHTFNVKDFTPFADLEVVEPTMPQEPTDS